MDENKFDASPFDIIAALTQILVFAAALESFIATNLGITIWCCELPQEATSYPQITYKLNKRDSFYTLSSTSRLVTAVYDISVIGTDKSAVDNTLETLRATLQGFRGLFGGLLVQGCRLNNRKSNYTSPVWGF